MRMGKLIFGDIRFQWKYGFYLIYLIFSVLYICLLSIFPEHTRGTAAIIMIYSDPAALGMFFMGAIVLMEKNEKIINALAVSPLRKVEYILSKACSFSIISMLAALALGIFAGGLNLYMVIVGTFFSSVIFTLIGIISAARIKSMNQYFLILTPINILCFTPPILGLFIDLPSGFQWCPFNAAMALITGTGNIVVNLLIVVITIAILSGLAHRMVTLMWKQAGGAVI